MKINKSNLQEALTAVQPGLARQETIEQATSFAFLKGRVVTYNDEISISHPLKGLDIEGAVSAKELYQFLAKVDQEEIEIDIVENEIRITASNTKAGLALQQEVVLPLEEVKQEGKWVDISEGLMDAMRFASFSCSKDMSKLILTCVNVRESGEVEASDNFRITQVKAGPLPIPGFLIPANAVRELMKYNVSKIRAGQGWVHFRTKEGTVFSSRVFEDNFPDVSDIIKPAPDAQQIQFPKSTLDILDRAEIFARRERATEEDVRVKIANNKITFRAQNDSGWVEESADIKYKGPELSFRIYYGTL
jgi:DNA polymerase III sliding clamp (beta) subunit (PCNA family)